jgi:transposase
MVQYWPEPLMLCGRYRRQHGDVVHSPAVSTVALASTGGYWLPVYKLLEARGFRVSLVNAHHLQHVPGRKRDVTDCPEMQDLHTCGLLGGSCRPAAEMCAVRANWRHRATWLEQRDLRDLTRYRTRLVQERSREVNRVQGVLERANIKLAAVATDIMGVSARAILAALVEGRTEPATMAALAKRRRRSKLPLLEQALTGLVRAHHRPWLVMQLAHIDFLDEQVDALDAEITRRLAALSGDEPTVSPREPTGEVGGAAPDAAGTPMTFSRAITLLDTIPGGNRRGGELLVAEWGLDMGRFGTAAGLAAWSGVAPGNDESAGKQRSGKTRRGNQALRTGLTQLAHAAARTKGTYLSALYQRLAARRGKKRALVAVAPSIGVTAFHLLSRNKSYRELGAHSFDAHRRAHLVDQLTRRSERLGYRGTLEPVAAA